MRILGRLAGVLLIAAVPILLIATNVRLLVNAPLFYTYGFDRYNVTYWTGIEPSELLSAGKQVRDYFNNDEELLDLRVFVGNIRRSLFSEREVRHMKDVKNLLKGVYRVEEVALAYVVLFAVGGLVIARRRFLTSLGRYVGFGGVITVGLVLVVGLASLLFFDLVFLSFHLVSFSNDTWLSDPGQGDYYMTAMFQGGFFFDATMAIGFLTVVEAVAISAAPAYLVWWRPRAVRRASVRQERVSSGSPVG